MQIAIFLEDVLFCLAGALSLILLLYWFNNGVFRATAPMCMAIGFYLCHISISKVVRKVFQWIVFGAESFICILCLPFKCLYSTIVVSYKRDIENRRQKRKAKKRQVYTKQAFQSIDKAVEQLLPIGEKSRMRKGDGSAKQRKEAV